MKNKKIIAGLVAASLLVVPVASPSVFASDDIKKPSTSVESNLKLNDELEKKLDAIESIYDKKIEALEKKYESDENNENLFKEIDKLEEEFLKEIKSKLGNSNEAKEIIRDYEEEFSEDFEDDYEDGELDIVDGLYDKLSESSKKIVDKLEEDFFTEYDKLEEKFKGDDENENFNKEIEKLEKKYFDKLNKDLGNGKEEKAFISELEKLAKDEYEDDFEDERFEDEDFEEYNEADEKVYEYIDALDRKIGNKLDNVSDDKLKAIIVRIEKLEKENKNENISYQLQALKIIINDKIETEKVEIKIDLNSLLK